MTVLALSYAGFFGLIVGSFLNVCIYRLPREESIVRPRSHCMGCQQLIAWYDNIPLLSFVWLRARCRHCKRRISWRYPLVELLSALLSVAIWVRYPALDHYVAYFLLFSAPLLVITFIDLDHLLIPDVISLPGVVVGVLVHLLLGDGSRTVLLVDSLLGITVGAGSLFLLSWVYEKVRGQVGLGFGDVKLAAMLGAFLGWRAMLFILLLSSVIGTVGGLIFLLISRRGLKAAIPYGPFLALAAWLYLFFGTQILDWYLELTRRLY